MSGRVVLITGMNCYSFCSHELSCPVENPAHLTDYPFNILLGGAETRHAGSKDRRAAVELDF